MGLPWIADGVTEYELQAVRYVGGLMEEHPLLAEQMLGLPWIADGVTENEVEILSFVGEVIEAAPEVVDSVLTIPGEVGKLTKDVVNSLRSILRSDPDRLKLLLNQPWFQDGLTNEEAALLVVLQGIDREENTFLSLIEGGHTVSDTISLQLSGKVNLYAVSPFPLPESVLDTMRTGTRVMEEFIGSPWNTPNVIVFVESEGDRGGGGGKHHGSHIVVKNSHPGTLYHELGHHYFSSMPIWLNEGAAEFLRGYILHHTEEGAEYSLQYRRSIVSQLVEGCAAKGASNIQEWVDAPSKLEDGTLWGCRYSLGEYFLQEMYRSLGHDVVRASLQQLYELHVSGSPVTEDHIHQTFLSNTAAAKQDDFRDLYHCLHGRPIPGYAPTDKVTPTHVRNTLSALYNATNGPDWKNNRNWLSEAPVGKWHGVVTNCDGDVVELQLGANNLVGPIPEELGSLSNLERLHLWNNKLTGEIPPELSNLTNLEQLLLSNNQLNGEIPLELSNLPALMILTLGENELTGQIPAELSVLPNLGWLYLDGNELTGMIPPELGKLSSLRALHVWAANRLSGPIPPELANASKLNRLLLDGNQLTGHIPRELGRLSDLEYLHLSRNQLAGPIPPELGSLSNLTELLAAANQLSGPIPAELGNLANLTQLNLALNKLSGQIPPELGSLPNLEKLVLARNELTGAIPPNLGKLSKLEWLLLSNNQLTGPIPPELGSLSNLKILNLGDDQLIGTIPPELGSLSSLTHLRLDGNQLTGPVPPELGNLSELERLLLAGNQLTGCIPKELQSVENNDFTDTNLPFC